MSHSKAQTVSVAARWPFAFWPRIVFAVFSLTSVATAFACSQVKPAEFLGADDAHLPHLPAADKAFAFEGEGGIQPAPGILLKHTDWNFQRFIGQMYKGRSIFHISYLSRDMEGEHVEHTATMVSDGKGLWERNSESPQTVSLFHGDSNGIFELGLRYWPMLLQCGDNSQNMARDGGMRWGIGGDPPPTLRTEPIEGGRAIIGEWYWKGRLACQYKWSFRETPTQLIFTGLEELQYRMPPDRPSWLWSVRKMVVSGEQEAGGLVFPRKFVCDSDRVDFKSMQYNEPQFLIREPSVETRLTGIREIAADEFERTQSDFCALKPGEEFMDGHLGFKFNYGDSKFSVDHQWYKATEPLIAVPDDEEFVEMLSASKLLLRSKDANLASRQPKPQAPKPKPGSVGDALGIFGDGLLSHRALVAATGIVVCIGMIMLAAAMSARSRGKRTWLRVLAIAAFAIASVVGWNALVTPEPPPDFTLRKIEFPQTDSQRRIVLLATCFDGEPPARVEFYAGEEMGSQGKYAHKGDWEPVGVPASQAVHWLREFNLDQAERLK
ncbi:MAG: hypothetical protein K8R92_04740 [Planctomycetes bacterium]|nr:hypothetical protein [Planctomycetota bacterium]